MARKTAHLRSSTYNQSTRNASELARLRNDPRSSGKSNWRFVVAPFLSIAIIVIADINLIASRTYVAGTLIFVKREIRYHFRHLKESWAA